MVSHRLGMDSVPALETVLASYARGHFRHGSEPRRRDGSLAILTDSVGAIAQPFQRLGELSGPLHEQAPRRETHLAIGVAAKDVGAIRWSARVGDRDARLLDHGAVDRVTNPVPRVVELGFQMLSDLVHASLQVGI